MGSSSSSRTAMAAPARHLLVMGLRRAASAPPDSPVLSGGPTFSSDTDVTSCAAAGRDPASGQEAPPALRRRPRTRPLVRPEVVGSRPESVRAPGCGCGSRCGCGGSRAPSAGCRRAALSLGLGLGLGSLASTPLAGRPALAAPPSRPPSQEDVPRFRRTANGVRYEDVIEGSGSEAKPGDSVQFNYVCRRSNGYFHRGPVQWRSTTSYPSTGRGKDDTWSGGGPVWNEARRFECFTIAKCLTPMCLRCECAGNGVPLARFDKMSFVPPNMQARGELWCPPQPDMSALTWNRNPRSSVLAGHSTPMQRSRLSLKSSCLKSYDWLARAGADGCGGARSMGSAVPHRSWLKTVSCGWNIVHTLASRSHESCQGLPWEAYRLGVPHVS
eukprot:SM000099S25253  [mRNA]  locus=s99:446796:449355:- [translate_table: standard]